MVAAPDAALEHLESGALFDELDKVVDAMLSKGHHLAIKARQTRVNLTSSFAAAIVERDGAAGFASRCHASLRRQAATAGFNVLRLCECAAAGCDDPRPDCDHPVLAELADEALAATVAWQDAGAFAELRPEVARYRDIVKVKAAIRDTDLKALLDLQAPTPESREDAPASTSGSGSGSAKKKKTKKKKTKKGNTLKTAAATESQP